MARKTKLTEQMITTVQECIELGMSYTATAGAVNITPETFANWMNWGKAGQKDPLYSRFYAAVRESEGKLMYDCLTKLRKAADTGNAESIRWLLERRFPEDFGKRSALDVTAQNQNLNLNMDAGTTPSTEEADKIRREILSKLTPKNLPEGFKN
jgi:hypothetical protein